MSIIYIGYCFRMIFNVIYTFTPPQSLQNLPVAHAIWEHQPNLNIAAGRWV
ncbi:hypothetical protein NPN23_25090 [Vibrio parahaemolyticus]|nr:hypothetical protein [Vibrio parahaemolyticus]